VCVRCPFCNEDKDRVVDSRSSEEGTVIRRRRECQSCSRRFTTYERIEQSPLRVIKKDGRRDSFTRDKIKTGVDKACWNLPIGPMEIERLISRVERTVFDNYEHEINSHEVGELVMGELRELDQVAYVRFASVYREFKDVSEFMKVLHEFMKGRE
jgi:transcriptional repressor NrdR